jgi:hypothetical protein
MSRVLTAATLLLCAGLAACGGSSGPAASATGDRPPTHSILAQPPPGLRLRAPGDALLSDQVVGAARRGGHDHLTAAQAASEQPDQGAALQRFTAWGWLDGASRTWATADETLVLTAEPAGSRRAFASWSEEAAQAPFAAGPCPAQAAAGLDDCRLGVAGDRAVVVGRLGTAVFRLACPASAAQRLTEAQVAALHG